MNHFLLRSLKKDIEFYHQQIKEIERKKEIA